MWSPLRAHIEPHLFEDNGSFDVAPFSFYKRGLRNVWQEGACGVKYSQALAVRE